MSSPEIRVVAGAIVLGGGIYLHLKFRTRRLRSVWAQAARTPAQRWARVAAAGGLLLCFGGLALLGVASGGERQWLHPVAGALAFGGYAIAMAGGFAVGYTADAEPSSRNTER